MKKKKIAKKEERDGDALQFRQFIWRAMRETERDKELRRRKRRGGGGCGSEYLGVMPRAKSSNGISKSLS